ncbi:MAG TPA: Jag N-terminal domain-containing protein, partial [Acidimicrobiales bacterium]|nr:Jag N-terminal domain-containing protein [Acidimicrobiales bacterium]
MEWVEVTGRTVEEAKDAALDQLGVDESEAEFEVLAEPRAGLFGRLRSEARVRARVQPTSVRPKVDRGARRRGRKDRPGSDENAATGPGAAVAPGEESAPPPPSRSGPRPARSSGGDPGDAPPRSSNGGARSAAAPRASRPERRPKSAVERGDSVYEAQEPGGDPGELGEEFLRGLV